jgi:lipopolysaccharide export system protein LptA
MPIPVQRLRRWFAVAASAAVLVVFGFYTYARYQAYFHTRVIPPKVGAGILRSSNGFTYSKSEGGRTIYTIKASKFEEFKGGGNALLTDVSIIVYGRGANRFDQISGKGFAYDAKAGEVTARGEVDIDLQGNAEGRLLPDQAIPHELKNPIHVRTSGLVFHQKTGIAESDELLQIEVPQAQGSARGVTYDSHQSLLTLHHDVELTLSGGKGLKLTAASAEITREPRLITLHGFHLHQTGNEVTGDMAVVSVNDDNSVGRIVATGHVAMRGLGRSAMEMEAPRGEVEMSGHNLLRSVLFSGGVDFRGTGVNATHGSSERLLLRYGRANQLLGAEALENVKVQQNPLSEHQQAVALAAQAVDFHVVNGHLLRQALTRGPAQIVLTPAHAAPGERTLVTAGVFHAEFDDSGHLSVLHGEPNAQVTQSTPGLPDRVSSSRLLTVEFASGGGGVYSVIQEGNFRYFEAAHGKIAERRAAAARALYRTEDESLTLSGSPRLIDGGMSVTAQTLRINRRSGDAFAQGSVKSTYSQLKATPGGAMLASADPVHVTAQAMSVQRASGIARYTGGARLWQGANAVQATAIEFNQLLRSLAADSSESQPVQSVFVQSSASGRTQQVVATSAHLTYTDAERRAHFSGGVIARSQDRTIQSLRADLYLKPSGTAGSSERSQLQQIVAEGSVNVTEPQRTATGEHLQCHSADGSCILSGGQPTIVDSQYGTLRGDSLTFFSRDDRVIVGSSGGSRTVTHTRVGR